MGSGPPNPAPAAPQAAEESARDLLRERQGPGARYDAPDAPTRELSWARLGTAYFARAPVGVGDEQLLEPSLLPGWSRAHLVAHVGYNSRALTRLVQWARTGVPTPTYRSSEQRGRQIERGVTLPPRLLRNLFSHSEVRVNVEWRDLAEGQWDEQVVTAQGRTVPVRESAWRRTREVWVHAVDLAPTACFHDVPAEVLDELLADVLRSWRRREEAVRVVLAPLDRPASFALGDATGAPPPTVRAPPPTWSAGSAAAGLAGST